MPFPEVPALASARIVPHPAGGRDVLLATTEDGASYAFGFELDSDRPGLVFVDPVLWLGAGDEGSPEHSGLRFAAVEDAVADDFLQAIATDPVGDEWLAALRAENPDAFRRWWRQADYEEGGEEGSG